MVCRSCDYSLRNNNSKLILSELRVDNRMAQNKKGINGMKHCPRIHLTCTANRRISGLEDSVFRIKNFNMEIETLSVQDIQA